jgi:hypothetical protein
VWGLHQQSFLVMMSNIHDAWCGSVLCGGAHGILARAFRCDWVALVPGARRAELGGDELTERVGAKLKACAWARRVGAVHGRSLQQGFTVCRRSSVIRAVSQDLGLTIALARNCARSTWNVRVRVRRGRQTCPRQSGRWWPMNAGSWGKYGGSHAVTWGVEDLVLGGPSRFPAMNRCRS